MEAAHGPSSPTTSQLEKLRSVRLMGAGPKMSISSLPKYIQNYSSSGNVTISLVC
jgi:hypothetical protein